MQATTLDCNCKRIRINWVLNRRLAARLRQKQGENLCFLGFGCIKRDQFLEDIFMGAGTGFRNFVFAAGIAVSGVSGAQAATVAFDSASTGPSWIESGFEFAPVRIVSGNCGISKACLALNKNEVTTMTLVGGGTFTLTSLYFELLGQSNFTTMNVTSTGPAGVVALSTVSVAHNTGYIANFGTLFSNVTSIIFTNASGNRGGGNVRIDDIVATATPIAPVPLPAAAGLLVMALGGMGFVGRRRKTVSA